MKRFCLSLLLIVPIFSFGQLNFKKGYVVTNVNDTLNGYLDAREKDHIVTSVQFKSKLDQPLQTFTISECAAFGIEGVRDYRRFTVDVSISAVRIDDLSLGPDSSVMRKSVFMEVLQTGELVNLYGYGDQIKYRYYILEKGKAEPVELIRQVYRDPKNSSRLVTRDKYSGQLLVLLRKNNTEVKIDESILNELPYKRKDLVKVVSLLNNQSPERKHPTAAVTRLFAGFHISRSNPHYYGGGDYLARVPAVRTIYYVPMIAAGLDFIPNPETSKVLLRMELSVLSTKNKRLATVYPLGSPMLLKHEFTQFTATFSPKLIYQIRTAAKFRFFGGLGAGINYIGVSNNKRTLSTPEGELRPDMDAVSFKKIVVSIPFFAGVTLNKKVELSAGYTLPMKIASSYATRIRTDRMQFGVNYLFGKR